MFQNILERVYINLTNVELEVREGFFGASKIKAYDEVSFELEEDILHVFFDRKLTADAKDPVTLSVKYKIDWQAIDRAKIKEMLSKRLNNIQMNEIVAAAPAKSSLLISQMLDAANLPLVVLPPNYLGSDDK